MNMVGIFSAGHDATFQNKGLYSERLALIIFLSLFLIRSVHFDILISDSMARISLSIEYFVYFLYMISAITRGRWLAFTISLIFIGFLILETVIFGNVSGKLPNFNAAAAYGSLLMVLVFYQSRWSLGLTQRYLLAASVAYVAVYVAFANQLIGILGRDTSLVLAASAGRTDRLYFANPLGSYVLFFGLFALWKRWYAIPIISLAFIALLRGESRFYLGMLAISTVSALLGAQYQALRRGINVGLAFIFIAVCCYSLYGILDPSFNPYQVIAFDDSGYARYLEYRDGMTFFQSNQIAGIGIPSSYVDLQQYMGPSRPFFFSDLGVAGVAMEFGLPFTFIFITLSVGLILIPSTRLGEQSPESLALAYTTQQLAFSGFFAAHLLTPAGAIFCSLSITLWLLHWERRVASHRWIHSNTTDALSPSPAERMRQNAGAKTGHTNQSRLRRLT